MSFKDRTLKSQFSLTGNRMQFKSLQFKSFKLMLKKLNLLDDYLMSFNVILLTRFVRHVS